MVVAAPPDAPLVELRGLCIELPNGKRVLDDINLAIPTGETFGLVGLSGSGKSTIGRIILGLTRQTSGEVLYEGKPLDLSSASARSRRAVMQMVFQNPLASFNPRRQIGESLELPLVNFGIGSVAERRQRIAELLVMVGLEPRFALRYPHELSGGQCQRAGIARALMTRPNFVFLDEPLSALDVSVQAQVANLLKDLQASLGLTYLFVANNLSMARFMSDRVAILDRGRVVEAGPVDAIFETPAEPFTRKLLAASLTIQRMKDMHH